MGSELEAIRAALAPLIQNNEARLSITVDTGYDEAGLVGTRDAYLRLAKHLVDFVAAAEHGATERW